MKKRKFHIVRQSQVALIAVGLIIGFLSLTFGVNTIQSNPSKPNQENDPKNDRIEIVQSVDAITSTFQINFNYQYFVMEVLPEKTTDNDQEADTMEPRALTSKAIKVLLRRIISPNAP